MNDSPIARDEPLTREDVERAVSHHLLIPRADDELVGTVRVAGLPIAAGEPLQRQQAAETASMLPESLTLRDGAGAGRAPPARGVSFGAGGQLEVSTDVAPIASALDMLGADVATVTSSLSGGGVALAFTGVDQWTPGFVPEATGTLTAATAAFLDTTGPWGRIALEHCCMLGVGLRLGSGDTARERWRLANLASPVITATFSTSPIDDDHSRRAIAWQRADPTRTGFPAGVLRGDRSLTGQLTEFVLRADVMVVLRAGRHLPGSRGFTFGRWLVDAHPEYGRPTADDLEMHLTTLFPEVRISNGFLEMRSCDALPRRWQPVPVVLMAGLLYDETARSQALEELEPYEDLIGLLWRAAAAKGAADETVADLMMRLWPAALAGADRLGQEFFGGSRLDLAHSFVATYPDQRMTPAGEIRKLATEDPTAALEWAAG